MIRRIENDELRQERMDKIKSFIAGAVFVICMLIWIFPVFIGPSAGFFLKNPMSVILYPSAYTVDDNMRELALNMTKECKGNQECVIIMVYNNLSQELVYSNTPYNRYLKPYQVLEQKSADCKSMSGLYVNLLVNMGVIAYVDSNTELHHAVAIAEPRDMDYYYVVDLTIPRIERYAKGVDHWKFLKAEIERGKTQ